MSHSARKPSQNSQQFPQQSHKPNTRSQAKLVKSPDYDMETGDLPSRIACECGCAGVVRGLQKEILALRQQVAELDQVKISLSTCQQELKEAQDDAKQSKVKLNMLTNVVIRLEEKVDDTTNKFVLFQARSMKKNLIISGLEEPEGAETQEMLLDKIHDFFVDKLKVDEIIPMKSFHRFGTPDGSSYRPIVIKLANFEHKGLLLSQGPKLKNITNDKGKKYFIREQLPDKLNEERKYYQHWVQENKHQKGPKPEMKIFKNKLRINNQPYKRKVTPPSGADILRLDEDELISIKQCKVIKGDFKLEQGSEFVSYAAKVRSPEDMRQVYRKLRIKYADATHISSAYRLHPPNGPFNQEATDDGEYGMGRALLKILTDSEVTNGAVFLVRYYGGEHIGGTRFQIAAELAKIALQNANLLRQEHTDLQAPKASRVTQAAPTDRGDIPTEFTNRLDLDSLLGNRNSEVANTRTHPKRYIGQNWNYMEPPAGRGDFQTQSGEDFPHRHGSAPGGLHIGENSNENSQEETDYDEVRSQTEEIREGYEEEDESDGSAE